MRNSLPCWVLFHSKDIFYNTCSSAMWVLLSLSFSLLCHVGPWEKKAKAEVCHCSSVTNPSESTARWNIMVLSWGDSRFAYIEMVIINSLMILSPLLLCHTTLRSLKAVPASCWTEPVRPTKLQRLSNERSLSLKAVAIEVQDVACSPFSDIFKVGSWQNEYSLWCCACFASIIKKGILKWLQMKLMKDTKMTETIIKSSRWLTWICDWVFYWDQIQIVYLRTRNSACIHQLRDSVCESSDFKTT